MKKNIITLAVTLSLTAGAAYLLSRAHPAISADSLVGYGVIAMLMALGAIEYRVSLKSVTGR